MLWLLLALISAFSLATADAFTKKLFPRSTGLELVALRFFLPAVGLFPIIFFLPYARLDGTFWMLIALSIPLEVVAMYWYLRSIRDAPLALTLPYLAFTPVFNIFTAWFILGERVSWTGVAGIVLIASGAYLINLKPDHLSNLRSLVKPIVAISRNKASMVMLGVAGIYSFTSVLSKKALAYMEPGLFGPFYYFCVGAGALLLVALLRPRSFAVLRSRVWQYLFIGALMIAMVVSHFFAIAQVEVAYMIAVKRTSLLFGLLYGYVLFHDAEIKKNMTAGVLMAIGVAAIVLS